jgi:hypothetical protein
MSWSLMLKQHLFLPQNSTIPWMTIKSAKLGLQVIFKKNLQLFAGYWIFHKQ